MMHTRELQSYHITFKLCFLIRKQTTTGSEIYQQTGHEEEMFFNVSSIGWPVLLGQGMRVENNLV